MARKKVDVHSDIALRLAQFRERERRDREADLDMATGGRYTAEKGDLELLKLRAHQNALRKRLQA